MLPIAASVLRPFVLLSSLVISGMVSAAEAPASVKNATVSVDFGASRGERVQAERLNNFSRARTFPEQRDADIQFYLDQGLQGDIYRVWVDAHRIYDPKTGKYDYSELEDYLADASRLSKSLLMVMDTRVEVRDFGQKPEQIKPLVKRIMTDLKKRYPQIKYIEAFNEPDHNLAKALKPEELYDHYIAYYQAVNEINRELDPEVPLQLGAPSFMQYNEKWMRAFLDRYKADPSPDKRLDFISWHVYGEFPEGDGNTQGPRAFHFYKGDPSEIATQRQRLEKELSSRGLDTDVPVFVTEIGIYPGPSFDHQNDPHPDYLIGAAGVPSLLYWLLEQPNTLPFNWVVRHFSEERKDQLITRAGEGKPIPTGIFTPYGNALLMMSKLKDERVVSQSSALEKGKGVYSIATRDESGVAVMIWNYQHTGDQAYDVKLDFGQLPEGLRGKKLKQRMYRIDDKVSNYWADPKRANLQQVSESVVEPGKQHRVPVGLSANALQLIVLEPVK